MTFNQRNETPLKHLFDGNEWNVYESNIINLSAGTPSESLLSKCNELFLKSTQHLLVRILFAISFKNFVIIYLR